MSAYFGDICFKIGTYEKNGETKNRYLKGGALFRGDDGSFYGVIEAVPVGVEGRFSVFTKDRNQQSDAPQSGNQTQGGDIPF